MESHSISTAAGCRLRWAWHRVDKRAAPMAVALANQAAREAGVGRIRGVRGEAGPQVLRKVARAWREISNEQLTS